MHAACKAVCLAKQKLTVHGKHGHVILTEAVSEFCKQWDHRCPSACNLRKTPFSEAKRYCI
eukprot:5908510-Amphidinium_carterae.1